MNNKTGKVIWFTFKQVVTSNWFCLISVLGLVCVFLSTQIDKIVGVIYGTTANISGQGSVTLSEHDATFLLQISIVAILFLMILIYGSSIANSVVEEKSGRIIETLLCYVKPLQLLVGKVIGYLLGVILQVTVWVGYYLLLANILEMPSNPVFVTLGEMPPQTYVLLIVALISGFVMYAFAFAALSSYANNAQDSTQLMFPVALIVLLAYFLSMAVMNGFTGIWARVFSMAPFFSPIVSVVTNDLIQLTWAEVAENAGIQMLEVVIVALICARFYRRGVVSYGIRKLSFNKLFKKG